MGRLKDLKFWDSCMPTKLELNVVCWMDRCFFRVADRIHNLSF